MQTALFFTFKGLNQQSAILRPDNLAKRALFLWLLAAGEMQPGPYWVLMEKKTLRDKSPVLHQELVYSEHKHNGILL